MKTYTKYINEAAYFGNIGFQEMVEVYRKASPQELKKIEKAVKDADWNTYKKLVDQILGVKLK